MRAQNRFDRFFLCGIDERACVYHQHVGVIGRRSDFHSALENASEHNLGIHQVLGASETDHADFGTHGGTARCAAYSTVTSASSPLTGFPFFVIRTASRSKTRTAIFCPRNSTGPSDGEIQRSNAGCCDPSSTTTLI